MMIMMIAIHKINFKKEIQQDLKVEDIIKMNKIQLI